VALTSRTRLSAALLLVPLAVLAGCSSSSTGTSGSTSTSRGGSCPSSGSTQAQTQPGDSGATSVTRFAPLTEGCIDQLTVNFAPTQPTIKASYENAAAAVLLVEFPGATLGPGLNTSVENPKGYLYVKAARVSVTTSGVSLTITLDKKRPFLISATRVPALLKLAIG